ncbi:MAG: twin-arginine translocase subunit TatC [Bryobacteraceae bacterium]
MDSDKHKQDPADQAAPSTGATAPENETTPAEQAAGPAAGESTTEAPGAKRDDYAAPDAPSPDAQVNDATDSYSYYDDYGYEQPGDAPPSTELAPTPVDPAPPPPPVTPPAADDEEESDPDEDGMLRMSFLEHLEELRARLIAALMGIGVAFVAAIYFTSELWQLVQAPARRALEEAGFAHAKLVVNSPTEAFSIVWVKLPILCAIFLSSPWLLYQVWSFIAPGLYKRERRWAAPFVISSAGLFVLGGLFAYFVAFRFGLTFLLGIAYGQDLDALISITQYFDLFVNVTLGMGLVFELPILIFFLALLRLVTPHFLIRNSRYAILLIVVVAAVVTPTPDVINLMLVSVPMVFLYFSGVFAAYLLWLSREGRRFPLPFAILIFTVILALFGGGVFYAAAKFGYRIIGEWPFLVR